MRYLALVGLFVLGSAGDAGAVCMTPPWVGLPASRMLPARGSLYVQRAWIESIRGGFRWIGGTGSLAFVELGDVVRIDYDFGSARSLGVRLGHETAVLTVGNAVQPSQPVVTGIEHDGYDGDFACAVSSFARVTIDHPVAAFHALWTKPCGSGRCVFADKVLASRTISGHGQIWFGALGCGTEVMPAVPDVFKGPPLPSNLDLALTAIEFDGRETPIRGAPAWSTIMDLVQTPIPRHPASPELQTRPDTPWPLAVVTGLVLASFVSLMAMTSRAVRRLR